MATLLQSLTWFGALIGVGLTLKYLPNEGYPLWMVWTYVALLALSARSISGLLRS